MNIPELLKKLKKVLNEDTINEMSRPRSEVFDNIDSKAEIFIEHTIKFLLWGELSTDWYKSIWESAKSGQEYTLKGSNKLPSKEEIKKYLVTDTLKGLGGLPKRINYEIDSNVQKINRPYPQPRECKYSVLLRNFNNFVDEICEQASQGNLTFKRTCELCQQYLIPEQL